MIGLCGSHLGRRVTIMGGLPLCGVQLPSRGRGAVSVLVAQGVHGTLVGSGHLGMEVRREMKG